MPELNATSSEHLSELELDEWSASELSPSDQLRCEKHVAECSECRARKLAIEQVNTAYYAQAPDFAALSAIATAHKPAPKPARSNVRFVRFAAPLLAACAAVAFFVVRPTSKTGQLDQPSAAEQASDTRSKGAPRLGYYVKRAETVLRGDSTTKVQPGDALRFVYSIDRAYYLAIYSADARGVGVYFPSGPQAVLVSAGQEVALDFSVQLDETPGRERVTALFCPEAFDVERVQSALSSGAALPPQLASCQTVGIELNKSAP